MADKEIIIYKKECYNEPYCSLNQVLEQLKAKEQECEELKQRLQQCWKVEYSFVEQLDQLKQTNEELQKDNEELRKEVETIYDDCKGCPTCNEALYNANLYAKEYRKLKQTITEIKEYFNEKCKLCKANYVNITDEICEECEIKYMLQKISESEVENAR